MSYLPKDWTFIQLFTYPISVPHDIAMSIHAVMHNQANFNDWELFDKIISKGSLQIMLYYVRLILEANDTENIDKELEWWGKQLASKSN